MRNTLKVVYTLILLLGFTGVTFAQKAESHKRYAKVPAGYLLVLKKGDNIVEQLETFAKDEKILSANFTGMGFVNVVFGFFDSKAKKFNPREFKDVELASMSGSIAWQKGKPSIHLHGVVAGNDFLAYGGHILSGTVGTGSLEIMVITHDQKFERVFDEDLGANILRLE